MGLEEVLRGMMAQVAEQAAELALKRVRRELRQEQDELLTLSQAAAVAKVSPDTISHWIRSGLLERRGSPTIIRVSREDVLSVTPPVTRQRTAKEALEDLERGGR